MAKNRFLDAKEKQTAVGRFINGTTRAAEHDVGLLAARQTHEKHGQPTIAVRTLKRIQPGAELFLNYGRGFRL